MPRNASKTLANFLIAITAVAYATAADSYWKTDYASAITEAKVSERLVLLNFTGSDWCRWCKKLDREVFATSAFAEEIENHAIPVQLDFPRRRQLSQKQARQNRMVQGKFNVETFPTIILYDPTTNRELLRHSYFSTTPEKYIEVLNSLKLTISKQDS